jgi:hypothetical protein
MRRDAADENTALQLGFHVLGFMRVYGKHLLYPEDYRELSDAAALLPVSYLPVALSLSEP